MEIRPAKTTVDVEYCRAAILAFRPNVDPGSYLEEVQELKQEGFSYIHS